ncbi:pyruvate dehydrogenase (acetyl-transferring), homodimeric type, partial [Paenarthrobacter sp. Z7-10]|nr:pyruvate dehydrogenase (acetyl-transferring), homodimeric type [Paenarthrobacter sp. Z7-10]
MRLDVFQRDQSPHILSGLIDQRPDMDSEETAEWVESLDSLIRDQGTERAQFILRSLLQRAGAQSVGVPMVTTTDYVNTIPADQEPEFPGDEDIERRYRRWLRWNAAIMVHRSQHPDIGVGGHISTYAGAATLYEVGFNHFFRGKDHPGGGDQIFFQGHASPGM